MTEIRIIDYHEKKKLDWDSARYRGDFWASKQFMIYAGYKATLETLVAWELMRTVGDEPPSFTGMEIIQAGSIYYDGYRILLPDTTIGLHQIAWNRAWYERMKPLLDYAVELGCVIDGMVRNNEGGAIVRTARCYRYLPPRKYHRHYTRDDGKGRRIEVNVD